MDNRDATNQTQQSQLPDVFALERLCVAWHLIKDPAIQVGLASLKANPLDREALEFVTSTLDDFRQAQNMSPDPFRAEAPTRFDNVDGEIVLGLTSNGTVYGIDRDVLCRHMLIAGASGSGKTSILKLLVVQLLNRSTIWR